ncbi:hypothetical protein [Candidatus Odyssella thessalonicensis]|uniref:hypothetical protein n=1 Tax=Candidatus Odyssella thessalonicensis TaxID=84647 RepID=UPI00030B597E|nr:hypothetical protein [Candidatus Odyssella thessalonicensis]
MNQIPRFLTILLISTVTFAGDAPTHSFNRNEPASTKMAIPTLHSLKNENPSITPVGTPPSSQLSINEETTVKEVATDIIDILTGQLRPSQEIEIAKQSIERLITQDLHFSQNQTIVARAGGERFSTTVQGFAISLVCSSAASIDTYIKDTMKYFFAPGSIDIGAHGVKYVKVKCVDLDPDAEFPEKTLIIQVVSLTPQNTALSLSRPAISHASTSASRTRPARIAKAPASGSDIIASSKQNMWDKARTKSSSDLKDTGSPKKSKSAIFGRRTASKDSPKPDKLISSLPDRNNIQRTPSSPRLMSSLDGPNKTDAVTALDSPKSPPKGGFFSRLLIRSGSKETATPVPSVTTSPSRRRAASESSGTKSQIRGQNSTDGSSSSIFKSTATSPKSPRSDLSSPRSATQKPTVNPDVLDQLRKRHNG